jgi:hypothetical protein
LFGCSPKLGIDTKAGAAIVAPFVKQNKVAITVRAWEKLQGNILVRSRGTLQLLNSVAEDLYVSIGNGRISRYTNWVLEILLPHNPCDPHFP